jgi:molecular chaperone DnaJ
VAADYYSLLGVAPQASDEDIKRAYRRMARELHPDRTGGDAAAEARFKDVTRAYEVLRDPERRARYDQFGPEGVDGPVPGAGDIFGGGLGDLFDAFFGGAGAGQRRRGGPVRGNDSEIVLELTFREAIFGTARDITLETPIACATCQGSGARMGTSAMSCSECKGSGELHRVRQSILGQVVTAVPCRRCGGTGEVITSPCSDCRGDGRVNEERTFSVEVPAGVDHGSTLRLSGRGPAGPRGGPAGDLYVHLAVQHDDVFVRAGDDLQADLHVSFAQAALGATPQFETLDGSEAVAVHPGTQSGQLIRLRGRGVPHVRGRGRGDLVIRVVVDTPTQLSKAQEDLLRQLAAESGDDVGPPDEGLMSRLRSAFG